MSGKGKKGGGPDLDWLRETRERAEGGGKSGDSGGKGKKAYGEDWDCNSCGNSNFARRTECFQCGKAQGAERSRSRSGSRDRERGSKGKQTGSKGRGEEDTSNDWECPKCSVRNFAKRSECFKCGAAGRSRSRSRSRHRSRSRPRDGGGKGKSKESKGKDSKGKDSKSKDSKGKGGGKDGGKASQEDNPETSRNLYLNSLKSRGARSRSGSSSSVETKKKARKQSTMFDSTIKTEAKPTTAPIKFKKANAGLEIEIGAKVDIHGLVGAAQYNGLEGKVAAGPNEKGRWKVELLFDGEAKDIALKPENLQPKPTCGWELVVAAISTASTEVDVAEAFAQFGKVVSCKVTRDIDGVSKGVALVVLDTKESAEKAVNTTEDIRVGGVPAKVQWSTMVKQQMGLLKNRDEEFPDGAEGASGRKFQEQASATSAKVPEFKEAGPFKVGEFVRVSGLKGAPQYNEIVGTVQGFREDGRCGVLLVLSGEPSKTLALKVENLSVVTRGAGSSKIDGQLASLIETPKSSATAPEPPAADAAPTPPAPAAAAAAATEPSSDADAGELRKRRRASKWNEGNDGGEVLGQRQERKLEGSSAGTGAATQEAEMPDVEALSQMSAKELKQFCLAQKVDVTGCFERTEYLEKAQALVMRVLHGVE